MSILKYLPESVLLDDFQTKIAWDIEKIALSINQSTEKYHDSITKDSSIKRKPLKLLNWLPLRKRKKLSEKGNLSKISLSGIYLYGGVGRGKTMLMKAFFELIKPPKELVHFQNFMQEMHKQMHLLRQESPNDCLQRLAYSISSKFKLIAIDEFEIKDIADAMLIMGLFEELQKNNVFIFITTNTRPNDLYKDGLQRELFLPCIDYINKNFDVLQLNNPSDYRFKKYIAEENRIFFPITKEIKEKLEFIKNGLVHNLVFDEETSESDYQMLTKESSINVFGRTVTFKSSYKYCLFTDFEELICNNFGYADYVNICQNFRIIVLENVEEISENETDKATRFINFIDNAYFYKVTLFITLEKSPDEIYPEGHRIKEFQRSISRLHEMNSPDYL